VIPVLVIDREEDAMPIGRALVAGGLRVLEVTMRTPAALGAIAAMKQVEGAIVGAGTVLNARHFEQAVAAGSDFIVSPGFTNELGEAAAGSGVPVLPGVANAGDIMRVLGFGITRMKFFPATLSGGVPALKAFSSVFGGVRFCPTGGISLATAPEWLALDSVVCVGGSWLVPSGSAVDEGAITERARAAAALRR
jgi:2-dehydro-3-deoxyphosphogluconate aldolase/(4S)-4-hydroxy-2-oxoglutarate aldolase